MHTYKKYAQMYKIYIIPTIHINNYILYITTVYINNNDINI